MSIYTTECPSGRDVKLDTYYSDAVEKGVPPTRMPYSLNGKVLAAVELQEAIDNSLLVPDSNEGVEQ